MRKYITYAYLATQQAIVRFFPKQSLLCRGPGDLGSVWVEVPGRFRGSRRGVPSPPVGSRRPPWGPVAPRGVPWPPIGSHFPFGILRISFFQQLRHSKLFSQFVAPIASEKKHLFGVSCWCNILFYHSMLQYIVLYDIIIYYIILYPPTPPQEGSQVCEN